jgi:hypothetical protein
VKCQQLRDIPSQAVVGRKPNGVFHAPFFQGLAALRLGKGGVSAKHEFLVQLLRKTYGSSTYVARKL